MSTFKVSDNAATTLATSISSSSYVTSLVLTDASKFPVINNGGTGTEYSYITLYDSANNFESVKVTRRDSGSNTLTIVRGTAAGIQGITDDSCIAWSSGTTGVACRPIAQTINDVVQSAASAASSASAASTSAGNAESSAAAAAASLSSVAAASLSSVAAASMTLTNKGVNLTSNTLFGTKAEFDAACSDGNFVYTDGDQTIGGIKSFSSRTKYSAVSAGAPSLAFSADTGEDTGFYWGGDGVIAFSSNGAVAGSIQPGGSLDMVGNIIGRGGLFQINNAVEPRIELHRVGAHARMLVVAANGTLVFCQSNGAGSWVRTLATLDVSGNFTAVGNVSAYSDIKLKADLMPIDDPLGKVAALTGYTFTRIDSGERQTGLIAQDVQAVLPEAVSESEDGTLSLAYGNLAGLLVEAIKALRAELNDLKALVA